MTYYHAVFTDECGGEFGAGTEANSHEEARAILEENYPESRIVQLESPADTREREDNLYESISDELDGDGWAEEDYDDEE